ncbi:MAG: Bro-N domain-containing protein [Magnetococcales bacterium]|nr:Bro-N domain-containing protein [Magnetococcales bacterium]
MNTTTPPILFGTRHNLTFDTHQICFIVDKQSNPWFNVKDVCAALGHVNPEKALANHVKEKDHKKHGIIDYINQSGVYSLTACSAKKRAKPFMQWFIRKIGVLATILDAEKPMNQEKSGFTTKQENTAYHIQEAFGAVVDLLTPVYATPSRATLNHVGQAGMSSLIHILNEHLSALFQDVGLVE